MSPETIKCLERAGWNKKRRIDISEFERNLNNDGYILNETVRSFLTSYGGLKVSHPHFRVRGKKDNFHLDPTIAISGIYPERVEGYNKRTRTRLTVIGEASDGHMVILMGLDGKVYAGYDDFLIFLGESGEEALETLCSGREAIEVP